MKIKGFLYNVFLKIFFASFIIIFFGTMFDNKSLVVVENPIYEIISFLIITIIFILIYKFALKKIDNKTSLKKEIIIVSIISIIFIGFQLVYAYFMTLYPAWDWNDVMDAARTYVVNSKEAVNWEYFKMFPNNNALLYIEIIIFKILKLFGLMTIKKSIFFTVLLNVFCIDLSVLFLYLTVRELFGKKNAIFSLIICMFSYAFYCYIPVFYTDTTTMFFPILMIFLYVKYNKNKNLRYLIILAIVSLIGYKIKPTVIITLIAIIFDFIFRNKPKDYYKGLICFATSFIICFSIIYFMEVRFSIFPYDVKNNDGEIPYTHWIMMGMTERESSQSGRNFIGWYNPDSVEITLAEKTTAARKKVNIKQIKKQFKDYGVVGYISFLYRKTLFTWSDGTFYAPKLVVSDPVLYTNKDNFVRNITTTTGKYIYYTFRQNIGMFLFMYLFILIGVFKNIRKKDNKFNYVYLSVFGLLLFLLIWEDSSRYLITYIPVILLCTINGFDAIIKNRKENILEEVRDKKIVEKIRGRENMKKDPILYVVIPCYNEEEVLEETTKQLKEKMKKLIESKEISDKSKVMYVNDGSKDKTWELIKKINKKEKLFTGVTLSRNRGHQNALLGGLMTAKNYADIIISMDADLQDDINAMDEMIKKYKEGNDIVYGVRSARKKDTFFKRVTAEGFYKFMKVLGVDCVYNHADYRLTSKRVLEEFSNFKEVNLFLRGMFPLVGFKSDIVYYERNERFAGESKYPLKKMLNFAWDGITSFSIKPLRLICTLGFVILLVSIGIMIYSLVRKITGNTISGWTFLSISIWFIGGLQMISLGIIGEYIGKMYSETKARPRFIISENLEEK